MIVTGTHCRKGLNRLIFGSDAESILRATNLPVLIVGPKAKAAPVGKWSLRFVLCAVNLDEHGADIALYSRQFAEEQGSRTQTVCLPFYDARQDAEGYETFKKRLREIVPADEADKLSFRAEAVNRSIDTLREQNAVNEARRLGIPVVAVVDTNADPELIDYPIAGNDDAIRAIRVILQKLVDAIVSASNEARIREQVEMAGVSA